MDTHDADPTDQLDQQELSAELDACRDLCDAHRTQLDEAEDALGHLNTFAADFLVHADTRLGDLRQRIERMRDSIAPADATLVAAHDKAQTAADDLAQEYAARITLLATALETLGESMQVAATRTLGATAITVGNAQETGTALVAHQQRVGSTLSSTLTIVDDELTQDSARQLASARERIGAFGTTLDTSLAHLRTYAEGEHAAKLEAALINIRMGFEQVSFDLKAKLEASAHAFATMRSEQFASLAGDTQHTYDKVTGAARALSEGVAALSGTVLEVKGAVEMTQTGLQLVAGILVRTKSLLESVSTLD